MHNYRLERKMDWEQIRARVVQLNKPSFENLLECYFNIGISNEARLYLPASLYNEINGVGDYARLDAGITEWRTALCCNGYGAIWTSMTEKYSEDSMRLCNNLKNIFEYEKRLIETVDKIIQCLSEIPHKIFNMNNALEISMSDFETIKLDLSQVTDWVTSIVLIWKHSKRYDTTCKWPECPKVESWLDAILIHSLNLWDRMKYLENMRYEVQRQNGVTYNGQSPFQTLLSQTEELMSRILNVAFFLEEKNELDEYPSRFVKEKNKFTLKFRHLMGKHLFLDTETIPTISLLNHKEVDAILANQSEYFLSPMHSSPPKILGPYNAEVIKNDQMFIEFAKFQVLKAGRVKPRPTDAAETVKDEKFCFLCEMVVYFRPELKIKVWTLSLPLICGTHGNQKTRSLGTILWDNAGSIANRTTLAVPSEISWSTLELALDRVHTSIANVPLTEANKRHLRARLIPVNAVNEMISFKSFCVDNLPGVKFTFWDWFFEGLKFGSTYFKKLWENGYVIGFLGRDVAQQFLSTHLPGTFLIRFSESVQTAITISFKVRGGGVYSAGPYRTGHFDYMKRLGEIIFELKQSPIFLQQFYPDKCIPDLETLVDGQPIPDKKNADNIPGYVSMLKSLVPMINNSQFN